MVSNKQRLYYLLPLALLGLLIASAIVPLLKGTDPTALNSPLINKPAPQFDSGTFDAPTLYGPGPVRVVNFFASWCPPCEAEHPMLKRIAGISGVRIIGINVRDTPEKRDAFLNRLGNPYTAIINDPDGKIGILWGTSGTPETFIIDTNGIIRHRVTGPVVGGNITTYILPYIKDTGL